ncbi:hypothetical protein GALMADRAFT_206344 [Galerina marginata CBS 339.88]|uniref:Uncharacterized protein n=1 Tax=Galerina marginata (strain CBS 339.88) TaxID=685588 RepID=A0A067TRG8_GALM3|nr:hypothetical protein GALMADRAFT_206344 [Galerina marginata CBS 339.88]
MVCPASRGQPSILFSGSLTLTLMPASPKVRKGGKGKENVVEGDGDVEMLDGAEHLRGRLGFVKDGGGGGTANDIEAPEIVAGVEDGDAQEVDAPRAGGVDSEEREWGRSDESTAGVWV